ncbi:hypothetical protein ENSA5_04070 [Enhygromyxa salina]|uniref:Cytotoxic translational repressor of toxin-antitoxin stability system n=1 Tax=Enhygromyxa salina TaxID=215803 RepID=A0A2S9YJK4_9BACT|nr:hypothetical protein [Enhygromyxa salina]PRQ05288.1 hypothetical protein ENSA5_04070 [Enhygromyxa salina]
MPWTIDDLHATPTPNLPRTCASTYYAWRRAIRDRGIHPKDAAEEVGDANYELYNGAGTKGTIRMSQSHRVWFTLNSDTEEVIVNKVGTHQQPRGW